MATTTKTLSPDPGPADDAPFSERGQGPFRLKRAFKAILIIISAVALSSWLSSGASAQGQSPIRGGGPISISADRMTADQNTSLVTFSGRVIARQGDLIITCDQMKVRYQAAGAPTPPDGLEPGAGAAAASIPPPPPQEPGRVTAVDSPAEPEAPQARAGDPLGGGQEIYRVDCEGSVRVQQGDKLAVGQKALYLAKSQPRRLILTGEARIWEGANSVTGHQVVYYLDQNRSQVESRDKQRVRAFYDQGGGEQGGSGPGGGRK